ncbi:Histone-lysine N-methyltransferase PRDM9 [Aphelenchoides avenae]|nr:Histone-lysine N-methyltransferase PRDM9 [Aphelenchus avenae]
MLLAAQGKLHSGAETTRSNKPFKCVYCPKVFATPRDLAKHDRYVHGEKPFRRTHTGEKPFACDFCGKSFAQASNLQEHARRDHTGERPHRCEKCGAAFVNASKLSRHMRTHESQREFHTCERCGREYADPADLDAHRAKYFAFDKCPERRYRCKFCGDRYTDIPLLRDHLRRHRTENQHTRALILMPEA